MSSHNDSVFSDSMLLYLNLTGWGLAARGNALWELGAFTLKQHLGEA